MVDIYDVLLTAVGGGLVLISNYVLEHRKNKKEELIEYRKELKKNMSEIVFPLYSIFDTMWGNLINTMDFEKDPPKFKNGIKLENSRKEIIDAREELNKFIEEKGIKLNLLFPPEMQGWKLIRLCSGVNEIITKIDAGENPVTELNEYIAECVDYQRNVQILLGFKFNETKLITHMDKNTIRYRLYNDFIFNNAIIFTLMLVLISMFIKIVYHYNINSLYFIVSNFSWLYVITNKLEMLYYFLYWASVILAILYRIFIMRK